MTNLMKKAIERLQAIPEDQQDQVAGFLLNELQEDDRWIRSTQANAAKLQKLVDGVLDTDRRGECDLLDTDRL